MFGTIRKHSGWLWWIIIIVMIGGLVVYFGPGSGARNHRGGLAYGTIDGRPITQEEFYNAYKEANLHFFMTYGSWPEVDGKRVGYDADRETYSRLFFIAKLKQNHIEADKDSVARTANTILANLGRGNVVPLAAFEEQVLKPHGMNAADFQRYIQHDLGIQQLVTTLGVAGKLVTPEEARGLYVRERQEMAVGTVFFHATNYLDTVGALAAEQVAQFYTNNMSAYRIPERLQVTYVEFAVTNFLPEADEQIGKMTNFAAIVDQVYLQRGTNYYKGSTTAAEAKTKIREDLRRELATGAARRKANDFASELFDQQPQRSENLATFAAAKGLATKLTAPFDEENGPADVDGGPNFARAAFKLTAEEPFSQPLLGTDAVFVIAANKRIPSEIPPLAQILSRVEADCKITQAARLARQAGTQFAITLTNGLAQGKTFAGICTDAKVKPTLVPPFSLSTRELPEVEDHITLNQFKQIVFDTQPGKSSGFVPTREGGVVVLVQQHLPIDEAKLRADMPEFLKNVRQARQNEAINLWYRREAERSLRGTLLQQRQAANGSARS
ncbi:MAG: SurA N-terminal domain-containing protein [Verrucomicrobiota bacterium]